MTFIVCCNLKQTARTFYISPMGTNTRQLVFLDECVYCGKPVAVIQQINPNGIIKQIVRKTGDKAIELFKKKLSEKIELLKVKNGCRSNMNWFWWDGLKDDWVRDFNNKKCFKL